MASYDHICHVCGKAFQTRYWQSMCCSRKCAGIFKTGIKRGPNHPPPKEHICQRCGKPYQSHRNYQKYCSYECSNAGKIQTPEMLRVNSEKNSGAGNANWKGGIDIKTAHNYKLRWVPDHPFRDSRNYILEHRYVMEQHLGRYLTKEEVVHHINEDPTDNRIENLKLLPNNSSHCKLHAELRRNKKLLNQPPTEQ